MTVKAFGKLRGNMGGGKVNCVVLVSCSLKPFNLIYFFIFFFLPWDGLGKMFSVDGDVCAFGMESL